MNHVGPAGAVARSVREDRVDVGVAAVADPLLGAVEPVADGPAVLDDRRGRRLEGAEVGAGGRLGGAVREEEPLLGDPAEPVLLLLLGAAEGDRVGAEEGREDARRDAEVDRGDEGAGLVDVPRAPAEPAVGLRDEHELDAESRRVAELADGVLGELVVVVELQEPGDGELLLREVAQALERHLEGFRIEAAGLHGVSLSVGGPGSPVGTAGNGKRILVGSSGAAGLL